MYVSYLESRFGIIKIVADNNFILEVNFVDEIKNELFENEMTRKCKKELLEYFANKRKEFDVPIKLSGTKFQNVVWNELLNVKYGKMVSYSDIAMKVANKNSVRAVASAIAKNKLLILVPCHRVIGKNNSLTGFSAGIEIKDKLLKLEKNI